jgi:hypothetical protein
MSNLALHDLEREVEEGSRRFNALAKVAGDNMAKTFHVVYIAPASVLAAAAGAALAAKFDKKGLLGVALGGAALWGASWFARESADVRNVLTAGAAGLGDAAVAIFTYDKLTTQMAATVAPAPAAV